MCIYIRIIIIYDNSVSILHLNAVLIIINYSILIMFVPCYNLFNFIKI